MVGSDKLNASDFNKADETQIRDYLSRVKKYYSDGYQQATKKRDDWFAAKYQGAEGEKKLQAMQNAHHNTKLADLVKNLSSEADPFVTEGNKLVATTDPIYRDASANTFIRAHFFAPTKTLFGKQHSTYWVNILVTWFMCGFMWLALYFDWLRKLLEFFASLATRFIK